jgi:hypothetical protein
LSKNFGPIIQLPENWKELIRHKVERFGYNSAVINELDGWISRLIRDAERQGFWHAESDGEALDRKNYPTDAAHKIFTEHIPEWANLFLKKNEHYGETANELGTAGQFADIWRKIGPLKRILWDHEELPGDSPEEILMDLIGHCFLTLYFLAKEEEAGDAHERFEVEYVPCNCKDIPKGSLGSEEVS